LAWSWLIHGEAEASQGLQADAALDCPELDVDAASNRQQDLHQQNLARERSRGSVFKKGPRALHQTWTGMGPNPNQQVIVKTGNKLSHGSNEHLESEIDTDKTPSPLQLAKASQSSKQRIYTTH
jgi:hypothetical protein